VSGRDVLQSPVLVGRDSHLGLIERWLADAAAMSTAARSWPAN